MAQKEFLSSLPEVVKHFNNCNLLLPTATDVQLNPFYKYHVEEVPVDVSPQSGDIFKVGATKEGDEWVEHFSPSKPLLNKLAMAAGIQFNPRETYGERVDKYTYRAHAMGAMKKADGTLRTETDQKEINLQDEEEKYRIEFGDKAARGITDKKQAKAAAEIFKGHWFDTKDKWGKQVQAFLIDECDRERYIERSVMVNMALLRKTWAEKAMTGAKLRVIKALLGIKGTYTMAELQRNFAIPTVVFSPDYSDPNVRQAMLMQGISSVNNMFGSEPAVKQITFEQETIDVAPDDIENAAFQSDREDDPAEDYMEPAPAETFPQPQAQEMPPQYQQAPPQYQQEPRYQPPTQAQTSGYHCVQCGQPISEKVYNYSTKKFSRALCYNCQKGGGR